MKPDDRSGPRLRDGQEVHVRRWELCGQGYCVRCRMAIPADPERPACRACEALGETPSAPGERFCLACGEPAETSTRDPVCAPCHERLYA